MKKHLKFMAFAVVACVAVSVASASTYQVTLVMPGSVQGGTLAAPKIVPIVVTEKTLAQYAGYTMVKGDTVEADIHKDGSPGQLVVRKANGTLGPVLASIQWYGLATDGKTKVVGEIIFILSTNGNVKSGDLVLTATVNLSKGTPMSVTGDIRGYVGLVSVPNLQGNIIIKGGSIKTKKIPGT